MGSTSQCKRIKDGALSRFSERLLCQIACNKKNLHDPVTMNIVFEGDILIGIEQSLVSQKSQP